VILIRLHKHLRFVLRLKDDINLNISLSFIKICENFAEESVLKNTFFLSRKC
jgi:hypothetical protein